MTTSSKKPFSAQSGKTTKSPKVAPAKASTYSAAAYPVGFEIDPHVPTREEILSVLRQINIPMTPETLAGHLNLAADSQTGYARRLAAMERDGQLLSNRRGELLLANKLDFIAGRVSGHRDGFGFLIRDSGGPDLFLSPKEMLKVLHGDRVLVKPSGLDARGRPEGTIVEIIERRTNQLVGRFLNERGLYIVVPEDQRIKHDVLIPPGDIGQAQHGQVVSVEIVQQPTRHTQPLGRVTSVLGEIDDPGMEIEIAVRKYDVPYEFSDAALNAAKKLPDQVGQKDIQDRIDLRDVPLITIDGEDARDFDDAVYCEPVNLGTARKPQPAWRLIVAIADVSHYVSSGDGLDQEAALRCTSVYFPRRVIPMLPEKLSNGLCSLNPEVDRLVLVCDMVIPASGPEAGQVTAYQFYNAVMYSHARLTYNQVWQALSQPEQPAVRKLDHLMPGLRHLYALYQLLAQARMQRGAIDFETTETQIICNEIGRIERIIPRLRNPAHKLIEECMLAANTCAADFMHTHKHPGLYRIHEGPTPERLQALRTFLKTLSLDLGGGSEPQGSDYALLLSRIRNRPDTALLQTMCLRSMQQAIYSPDNMGHFGLSYPAYAHFTSPIRRYPDLLTHRVIKALLEHRHYVPSSHVEQGLFSSRPVAGGELAEQEHAIWEKLGLICSANERRADEASRDVEAWLKCWFMKERVGDSFSGTVSGVATFGVFVTLDELFIEGLIHVSELGTEYFQFNEAMHELRGERTGIRYRLTERVQVQVSRVDLEARRIEFRLIKGTSYAEATHTINHRIKEKAREPKQLPGNTASPSTFKSDLSHPKKAAVKSAKKNASRKTKSAAKKTNPSSHKTMTRQPPIKKRG